MHKVIDPTNGQFRFNSASVLEIVLQHRQTEISDGNEPRACYIMLKS